MCSIGRKAMMVHTSKTQIETLTTKKNKVPRKKRVTSLSAGTEKQKMMQTETARGKDYYPFQAATRRSFEHFWDQGAESTSTGSGVFEQDEGRGTSAVLVHQAQVWTRGTRGRFRDRDDAHGHQQSVLSRSMQRRELNMLSCHFRCGATDAPSMDGSECRCTSLVTKLQTGGMRMPKYCGNISSTVGLRVHVHSIFTRERNLDYCPCR